MLSAQIKTASNLKMFLDNQGSRFFSRNNMRFHGDTMRNFGLRRVVIRTKDNSILWGFELYRKAPVQCGLTTRHYFVPATPGTVKRIYTSEINYAINYKWRSKQHPYHGGEHKRYAY